MTIRSRGFSSVKTGYLCLVRCPPFVFAEGMTSYLYAHKLRVFDCPSFAQPFRDRLRGNAEQLARENGIERQRLRKGNVRKKDLVEEAFRDRVAGA